ncbi:DoxX family membrane protein, partial [Bacillus sp. SS-TM]
KRHIAVDTNGLIHAIEITTANITDRAGATELLGGFLFASGIFIVVGSLFIVGTMLMAIFTVHGKNGYWVTQNGYEYNLMLIAVAVGVALIGPGAYVLL